MHEELIIAGAGGQGIVLMGELLCLSAMEEKNTTGFPSYGVAMRSGKATYTVIISSDEIGSPISEHPDSLIVMNKLSLAEFAKIVQPKGLIIINKSLVDLQNLRDDVNVLEIKATDIAQELGDSRAANLVMLGFYIKIKETVSLGSVKRALKELLLEKGWNKDLIELNQKALERGFKEINKPC